VLPGVNAVTRHIIAAHHQVSSDSLVDDAVTISNSFWMSLFLPFSYDKLFKLVLTLLELKAFHVLKVL